MAKLHEPDFVPTGGAPGCELSGPPETPLVETPDDQASVCRVGPAPGEATPSVPVLRDARAAVAANLPPSLCRGGVDEGGGSTGISVPHPESPPAGANAQAGGPGAIHWTLDAATDAALFGGAYFRNGARVSPGEFTRVRAEQTPPRLPPAIHRDEANGTTDVRLTTAKLVVDDSVVENLPFSPSPMLEVLLRVQDEVRDAIQQLTGLHDLRASGYAGLFDGCRRVTAAEQDAMRRAEREHEFSVGVRRLMAKDAAARRLVASEMAERERADRAPPPADTAPRRSRRWWAGRWRGER